MKIYRDHRGHGCLTPPFFHGRPSPPYQVKDMSIKPLGKRNYGSIPHMSGSRLGPSDQKAEPGQEEIATQKLRRGDHLIVTEKMDGSNVGVAMIDDVLFPLTRAGYLARTSPYEMHYVFSEWVYENSERFKSLLKNGERVVGEWCVQAHGTLYRLDVEPFFIFDLFGPNGNRVTFDEMAERDIDSGACFPWPRVVYRGSNACSVEQFKTLIPPPGFHMALDGYEGGVWRVETHDRFNFIMKYVRQDKEDGKYLEADPPIINSWVSNSEALKTYRKYYLSIAKENCIA